MPHMIHPEDRIGLLLQVVQMFMVRTKGETQNSPERIRALSTPDQEKLQQLTISVIGRAGNLGALTFDETGYAAEAGRLYAYQPPIVCVTLRKVAEILATEAMNSQSELEEFTKRRRTLYPDNRLPSA